MLWLYRNKDCLSSFQIIFLETYKTKVEKILYENWEVQTAFFPNEVRQKRLTDIVGLESGGAAPLWRFIYKIKKTCFYFPSVNIFLWENLLLPKFFLIDYQVLSMNKIRLFVVVYWLIFRVTYRSSDVWKLGRIYFAHIPRHDFGDGIKRVFALRRR